MAGGDERTPRTSNPRRKSCLPRESVCERSSERRKEGSCSSSSSVGSNKSPTEMVTPVQQPKYLDSPTQMVTPVELSKSLGSMSISSGSGSADSHSGVAPFDICPSVSKCSVKLNRSLLEINRAKRREMELSKNGAALQHLRNGMILLKKFLKPNDQVKIVKLCQELGIGLGGFYAPGYRDGAKLTLQMMCLGKNWDPDSSSYGDKRPSDGAQPPNVPEEFTTFVKYAIQASHEYLKQKNGASNPLFELPQMSPDICIVNFYRSSGKLGLHQDKDETRSSLNQGLPVVSFSLGDSAEFLYGDVKDEDKASKVLLESGDVLIFGGQARLIFHGVSKIIPNTAPDWLTDETKLRPGRLNLTFRQY